MILIPFRKDAPGKVWVAQKERKKLTSSINLESSIQFSQSSFVKAGVVMSLRTTYPLTAVCGHPIAKRPSGSKAAELQGMRLGIQLFSALVHPL